MSRLSGPRISILIAVVLFAAVFLYVAFNRSIITVERVQVELASSSNEHLLFQRIKASLEPRLQSLEGKYFWSVGLKQIYEIIIKDKRVRHVTITRQFPSTLKVEIEPHTPILAYLGSDNRIYPVATDATLLPSLMMTDVQDLPILRGEDLKDEQRLREMALELFEVIPQEGDLRKKNVSEISYSKKDGFEIFVSNPLSEIKLGETDFGPKIGRVEKVLSYLDSQNILGRVIDARFAKKVVVRVRKGP